ncbi:MAG: SUMF1/EgtB/PvdO family nonheme iron enzyme, partial [Nitrospira sp.]
KYEVTFKEYDAFAIATDRDLPSDQQWGRDRRPVINVAWDEANAYAEWLSGETGKHYRLPTESEWEYAARSGAKDVWAGPSNDTELGEYAVFLNSASNGTTKVGTKKGNGFGLHDLSGNVWEWVEDCAHLTYLGVPNDGAAWLGTPEGNCKQHVGRGGSWDNHSGYLRVSYRTGTHADYRSANLGFRLAQDP